MRDMTRQLSFFAEVVEVEVTRDHVNDIGQFVQRPAGAGWRVVDYSHEKRTTWQRRKSVILPRRWRRR